MWKVILLHIVLDHSLNSDFKLLVPYPAAQAGAPPVLTCEERVIRFLQVKVFGGLPADGPPHPSSSSSSSTSSSSSSSSSFSSKRGMAGLLAFFALPADEDALSGDDGNGDGEV